MKQTNAHRLNQLLLGIFFAFAFYFAAANIIRYENLQLDNNEDGTYAVFHKVGMYSPDDTPAGGGHKSFVHYELNVERESDEKEGYLEIVLLHESRYENLGYIDEEGEKYYCCTRDLFNEKACNFPLHTIIDTSKSLVYKSEVSFPKGTKTARIESKTYITETGYYYIYFTNCNQDTSAVYISGVSEWKNPYGYLPGQFYQLLSWYGYLAILYVMLGLVWMGLSAFYWRDLTKLQMCIAGLIVIGMAEMATTFYFWEEQNQSGRIDTAAQVFSTLLNVIKKSTSRLLVLVVSMGYGVVRPTLGSNTYKVLLYGLLYFIFSGLLEVVENMSMAASVSLLIRIMFTIPVVFLDAAFIYTIFYSLNRTISNLVIRRQTVKVDMYRNFYYVMVGCVVLSLICAVSQVIVELSGDTSETWEDYWVVRVYWQSVYFLVLSAISFLWRPCENNLRFSYTDEITVRDEEEIEEDLQPLTQNESKLRPLRSHIGGDSATPQSAILGQSKLE